MGQLHQRKVGQDDSEKQEGRQRTARGLSSTSSLTGETRHVTLSTWHGGAGRRAPCSILIGDERSYR